MENFPVDVVVLWVDGNDENHQKKMLPYLKDKSDLRKKELRTRFDQVEEVKYTIDSILKNASFIRNIYLVTDSQTPEFLINSSDSEQYNNVKLVKHEELFSDCLDVLPVFNCRPLETRLYKIPGLAEHFVYFNDDMFLLKKVQISDFFISGKPVLRGKWLKFDDDVLIKQIKANVKGKKNTKAGHKIAQQKGAKLVGFNKYYKFHHTPYALRKSTFHNFFKENQQIEKQNISHRFRHVDQFTPQGLINHVEIKNNSCVLHSDYQMLYIQSYKKPLTWYKFLLNKGLKDKNTLFLCLQSLDQCAQNKQVYILNWLKKILS
ncbi:MAG: hypothetical protein COB81_03230 [Flavobacteriaceae bacterium]|nr:MAG: hypothetical protein COB81_03230 [Flavobacteriaceae bacterium]